jgi:hypothetical protein
MQFPSNAATEITAPAGVPFAPGNDIIGIGTDIPPELAAEGITAAILAYTSSYDPTAIYPQVQYMFIAVGSTGDGTIVNAGLAIGFGVVVNASVSQTAVIKTAANFIMETNVTAPFNPAMIFLTYPYTGNAVNVMTHGSFAAGFGDNQNGIILTLNQSGTETGHIGGP